VLVAELEALVAHHPHRERLRAQLMLALYRCGRKADALEEYQAARRALVVDLGIEPGRRLQELERKILAHDPFALAGNSVLVVDPATLAVVGEIPIGGNIAGIAVGEGSVWVGNRDRNALVRIDPRSRVVRASIRLGAAPLDVAAGDGSVWVLNEKADAVLRVDPATNAVVARMRIRGRANPPEFGLRVPTLRVGGGAVWVTHAAQRFCGASSPRWERAACAEARSARASPLRNGSSTGDCAVDQQQDDRAHDRREPRADVEELVDRIAETERARDEAAEQRADDADDRRDDEPTRVVAG
jgi:hypothetical protein